MPTPVAMATNFGTKIDYNSARAVFTYTPICGPGLFHRVI